MLLMIGLWVETAHWNSVGMISVISLALTLVLFFIYPFCTFLCYTKSCIPSVYREFQIIVLSGSDLNMWLTDIQGHLKMESEQTV